MNELEDVLNLLKHMADESNAGKAYVEYTLEDGGIFRIEYKTSKTKSK